MSTATLPALRNPRQPRPRPCVPATPPLADVITEVLAELVDDPGTPARARKFLRDLLAGDGRQGRRATPGRRASA